MKIRYDPSADALFIRLRDGEIDDSDEVSPGIIMDYNESGALVGIEILDASRVMGGREVRVELAIAGSPAD